MADAIADVYVRLDGMKGECTDASHPGSKGWIQIKSFNFGFGMKEGSWESGSSTDGGSGHAGSGNGAGSGGAGATPLPLEFPEVTLTKSSDVATTALLKEKCHEGSPISMLELIACRYGGNNPNKPKIPFLRIIFKDVYICSVSLSLSQDELPGETIKFTYDIVQMETIWTDNETGDRLTSEPNRCGWNKKRNVEYKEHIESAEDNIDSGS
jgi:type VI protein secretion system component Hcp